MFELRDLPDGWYAVIWNRDRWRGVYVHQSKVRLLRILFEEMDCYEVGLAVTRAFDQSSEHTLYVKSSVFSQSGGVESVAESLLSPYCVEGVCFPELRQAEQFKHHLEQLYIIKLLSRDYTDETALLN